MPPAQAVLMEVEGNGSAQVYRYTLDGEFAGDTWHESKENAQDQLEFEYGGSVGTWSEVPREVADAHEYLLAWARESRPDV